MSVLAANRDRLLSNRQIADFLGVSADHLSKVLQRLHKARLVKSVRGPKGGFILNKEPEQITLLDVYEVIEGEFKPLKCLLGKPVCLNDDCIFLDVMETANERVMEYLTATTIAQTAKSFNFKP